MKIRNLRAIFLLLIFFVPAAVNADEVNEEWGTLTFLQPKEIDLCIVEFPNEVKMVLGELAASEENLPYFRLLQGQWATYLNPELTADEFLSYYFLNNDDERSAKRKAFQLAKTHYPTRESIEQSPYAKRYGVVYLRAYTLLKYEGVKYCVLDYSYTKDAPKDETVAVFGVFHEGLWKIVETPPSILDYSSLPWGPSSLLKEGLQKGFLLYEPERNSFRPVSIGE